jgi:hypothetical protein
MKPQYLVLVCVFIALAGCPAESETRYYGLSLSIDGQSTDTGFDMEASVVLEGRPPNTITYHGVKVIVLNGSTELAEYELGDINTSRYSVPFNDSVRSRPDTIYIKYDSVTGADGPGEVNGCEWDSEAEVYQMSGNYTREY